MSVLCAAAGGTGQRVLFTKGALCGGLRLIDGGRSFGHMPRLVPSLCPAPGNHSPLDPAAMQLANLPAGAPESVLERCSGVLTNDGSAGVQPLTPGLKAAIHSKARRGWLCICVLSSLQHLPVLCGALSRFVVRDVHAREAACLLSLPPSPAAATTAPGKGLSALTFLSIPPPPAAAPSGV